MTGMNSKQAAARVRKLLSDATKGVLTWPDGYQFSLPDGLQFTVRATQTGVNITIGDAGYVDQVTDGNRRDFGREDWHKTPIVDQIEEFRGKLFTPPLPGKTEWGPVIISAQVTGVTRIGMGSAP